MFKFRQTYQYDTQKGSAFGTSSSNNSNPTVANSNPIDLPCAIARYDRIVAMNANCFKANKMNVYMDPMDIFGYFCPLEDEYDDDGAN